MLPEAAVALDPAGRVPHGPGAEPAAAHAAVLGAGQQAGALEHPQVLVYAGQRHPERSREVGDRGVACREPRENRATRRIGQRAEDGVEIERI